MLHAGPASDLSQDLRGAFRGTFIVNSSDPIGVSRPAITSLGLVARWERGADENEVDQPSAQSRGEGGYTDYPFLRDGIPDAGFSSVTTRDEAVSVVDDEIADLVAVGRPATANPDLVERWEREARRTRWTRPRSTAASAVTRITRCCRAETRRGPRAIFARGPSIHTGR